MYKIYIKYALLLVFVRTLAAAFWISWNGENFLDSPRRKNYSRPTLKEQMHTHIHVSFSASCCDRMFLILAVLQMRKKAVVVHVSCDINMYSILDILDLPGWWLRA